LNYVEDTKFLTTVEYDKKLEQTSQLKEEAEQKALLETQRAEQERLQADELARKHQLIAEKLKQLGIEFDAL
jgi:hypothetical protein